MARRDSQQPGDLSIPATVQRTLQLSASVARSAAWSAAAAAGRPLLVQGSAIPWLSRYVEQPRRVGVLADSFAQRYAVGAFRVPALELTFSRFGALQRQFDAARRLPPVAAGPQPAASVVARVVEPDEPVGALPEANLLPDLAALSWTQGDGGVRPPSRPGPAASAPSGGLNAISRLSEAGAGLAHRTPGGRPTPFATVGAGSGHLSAPQPIEPRDDLLHRSASLPPPVALSRSVGLLRRTEWEQVRPTFPLADALQAGVQRSTLGQPTPLQRMGLLLFAPAASRAVEPATLPLSRPLPAAPGESGSALARRSDPALAGASRAASNADGGARIARAAQSAPPMPPVSRAALGESDVQTLAGPAAAPLNLPAEAPPLSAEPATASAGGYRSEAAPRTPPIIGMAAPLQRMGLPTHSIGAGSGGLLARVTSQIAPALSGMFLQRLPLVAGPPGGPAQTHTGIGAAGGGGRAGGADFPSAPLQRLPLADSLLGSAAQMRLDTDASSGGERVAGSDLFAPTAPLQRLSLVRGVLNTPMQAYVGAGAAGGIGRAAGAASFSSGAPLQRLPLVSSTFGSAPQTGSDAVIAGESGRAAGAASFSAGALLQRLPLVSGRLGGPAQTHTGAGAAGGGGRVAGAAALLQRTGLGAGMLFSATHSPAQAVAAGSGQGPGSALYSPMASLQRLPLANSVFGGPEQTPMDIGIANGGGRASAQAVAAGSGPSAGVAPLASLQRLPLAAGLLDVPQTHSGGAAGRGQAGGVTASSASTPLQRLPLSPGPLGSFILARSGAAVSSGGVQTAGGPPSPSSAPLQRSGLLSAGGLPASRTASVPLLPMLAAARPAPDAGAHLSRTALVSGDTALGQPLAETGAALRSSARVSNAAPSASLPLVRRLTEPGTLSRWAVQPHAGAFAPHLSRAAWPLSIAQADLPLPATAAGPTNPLVSRFARGLFGDIVGKAGGSAQGLVGDIAGKMGGLSNMPVSERGILDLPLIGGSAQSLVDGIAGNVGGSAQGLLGGIAGKAGGSARGLLDGALGNVGSSAQSLFGDIVGKVSGFSNALTAAQGGLDLPLVSGSAQGLLSGITGKVGGSAQGLLGGITGKVGGSAQGLVDGITGKVGGSAQSLLGGITGKVGGSAQGLLGGITSKVGGSAQSLVDGIAGKIGAHSDTLTAAQDAPDLPLVSPRGAAGPFGSLQSGVDGLMDTSGGWPSAAGGASAAGRAPLEFALSQSAAAPAPPETPQALSAPAQGAATGAAGAGPGGPAEPDIDALAQKVYDHLRRTARIEHERLGRW